MKVTIFGATGNIGAECLTQCLDRGYDVTVLVRTPNKIPAQLQPRLSIVQGDALVYDDVVSALPDDTDAVLFAVGVDEKTSPENLCTNVTRHILTAMRDKGLRRLVWCGGGSNIVPEDTVTFGAKFVRWYAEHFLRLRHFDKENQLALLNQNTDIDWVGVRPLQMKAGPRKEVYRVGFNKFSGMSSISFADCAHCMLGQLNDDSWLHRAPIIQY